MVRTIAVLAMAVVLTSCAPPEPEVAAESAPTPAPTPSATVVPPVSAFDLECDDLVQPELMTAVWGESLQTHETRPLSVAPSNLIDASVLHDGALSCSWALEGEGESALTLVALPQAEAAWSVAADTLVAAPYGYARAPLADGAVVGCDDSISWWGLACVWNATLDDVWIFVGARFLPESEATVPSPRDNPDTSRKPLEPTTEGSLVGAIVDNALTMLAGAPRAEVPRPTQTAPDCAELFSSPSGVSLLDGREPRGGRVEFSGDSLSRTNQYLGGAMGFVSAERLGYVECHLPDSASQLAVSVAAAPEADWIFEQPGYHFPSPAEHIGSVTVSCAEYSCLAFAVVDGTVLTAETSSGEVGVDIARDAAAEAVAAMVDSRTVTG